jgi:membrane-bound ClpP family serine protease
MTLIIILLGFGAILMFLEIFLPGLVTGMVGFLCWVAAVILSYRDFGLQTGNLVGHRCYLLVKILPRKPHRWTVHFPAHRR